MSDVILETKHIVKKFPGVRALDDVSLSFNRGEVHAIVGENGAGKSTLMMVLGGIYKPDAGELYIDGMKTNLESAYDAARKGISIVFQELSLIPCLSIAENIFANRQPVNGAGFINRAKLNAQAAELLKLFDLDHLNPETLVKDLSIANQQVIEILKAISVHPKLLILDEPTSSLTENEIALLFRNIRRLKAEGMSFIYISHHLSEIFQIADVVSILRDGQYVCSGKVSEINEDFLVTNMVGRKIIDIYGHRTPDAKIGDVVFEARNITRAGLFSDISFTVHAGEIVGFSGLVGAGRTEVGRAIFGAEPPDSGEMLLSGKRFAPKSPQNAIAARVGYMTEDRKSQGLFLSFPIRTNLVANRLRDVSGRFFIRDRGIDGIAAENMKEFRIAAPTAEKTVVGLSGGNQQKVMIGAWFGIKPRFLIVDEPTRGVDVGAKSEIYALLRSLAAEGTAIMMISSDLPEILGMSDRIFVMQSGRIQGCIPGSEATEESVIALAAGTTKENA